MTSLPYAQTKVLTFVFICFNLLLYFYYSSRNKVRSTYDIYVKLREDVFVHVGVWVHVDMRMCMCLVVVVVWGGGVGWGGGMHTHDDLFPPHTSHPPQAPSMLKL